MPWVCVGVQVWDPGSSIYAPCFTSHLLLSAPLRVLLCHNPLFALNKPATSASVFSSSDHDVVVLSFIKA